MNKKFLIIGMIFISLITLLMLIFIFLEDGGFSSKQIKSRKKTEINVNKNKLIEAPQTEDVQSLINNIITDIDSVNN